MPLSIALQERLEKLLEEPVVITNRDIFDERSPVPQSSGGTPFLTTRPTRLAGVKTLNEILQSLNTGLNEVNAGLLASTTVFVFAPGTATSALTPNVYNSWANLMAALAQTPGSKIIVFDDTNGAITIPAGTYDLDQTLLRGNRVSRFTQTPVNLADGVIFQNLTELDTIQLIGANAVSPLFTVPASPTAYNIYMRGSRLVWSGAAAMFSIPAGQSLELDLAGYATTVINAGGPGTEVVEVPATATVIFAHGQASAVSDDAVRGAGALVSRHLDSTGTLGTTQTNFAGTLTTQRFGDATNVIPGTLTPGNWGGSGVPATVNEAIERIATAIATAATGVPIA